ncbi:transmembrane protein 272-like [Amphiprion ocellaris]|uniref:Uncharacterized protein n=1 Tax=Amphiprion ocellaris TaxID=80972 RepID=A0AAQ5ZUX7_AMPOC|nr:transmembrane protein 272-like [Amphiprion ocellaris]
MESKPRGPVLISTVVVVNVIWWMVMIAAIGLGATHLGRCNVQPNIPIYLIVLGATSILSLSVTYSRGNYQDGAGCILTSACMTFLHLFTFVWFIAGTSWVYSVYPPDYSPGTDRYCHQITYQFAFIVTTILWVTTTLMFICGCCFALVICCKTIGARRYFARSSFYGATSDVNEPTAGDV